MLGERDDRGRGLSTEMKQIIDGSDGKENLTAEFCGQKLRFHVVWDGLLYKMTKKKEKGQEFL